MIWCDSRQFVYYSFPKTASESVRHALAAYNERSIGVKSRWWFTPRLYAHIAPRLVQPPLGYFRLTMVRHPYARLCSLYAMICRVDRTWRLLGPPDFEFWLEGLCPTTPKANGPAHQGWRQYGGCSAYYWTHDASGALLVDHVIKLEELAQNWTSLLHRLDLPPAQLPHMNANNAPPPHLSARAKSIILEKYTQDFEVFDYAA